ncbi:MAG: hypothetical protein HYT70_04100 [Candidatus Aenigmarchaeota archaeon]|nr:hypothetical protein [Candidatus Aenigmarchaeota archaeon]
MKGVSTVVATLLMLMITIALAGTAYLYIAGTFQQQLQGLDIVDAFCSGGTQARFVFKNIGTNPLTFVNGACAPSPGNTVTCGSVSVTRTSGGGTATLSGDSATVDPGRTATIIDGSCTSAGTPRSCVYRIVPPTGRAIPATVSCTG